MPEDEKQPEEGPVKEPQEADAPEEGEEAPPEEHPRKHKRKGELRKLHDLSSPKQAKRHDGRVHRRKSM
jgi:hypothetical protein